MYSLIVSFLSYVVDVDVLLLLLVSSVAKVAADGTKTWHITTFCALERAIAKRVLGRGVLERLGAFIFNDQAL